MLGGSGWGLGNGQAGPCMGRCMGGGQAGPCMAWCMAWCMGGWCMGDDVVVMCCGGGLIANVYCLDW